MPSINRPFRILFIITFCIGLISYVSGKNGPKTGVSITEGEVAEALYLKQCKLCHGKDGQRMLSGAKDLSTSTMSLEERIKIITEGKGKMASYSSKISQEEIESVAIYIETLRHKPMAD
jgi:mono/diheme cytochrome c family protein